MGERHFGEFLWLGVLQCMSSILATEKETSIWRPLASRSRRVPGGGGEGEVINV